MMRSYMALTCGIVIGLTALASEAADIFIGGSTPWQRPANAPVIETVDHDEAWFRHALTGISRPYPASLGFLDDQGNWHTPFNRPGMTGPYDIRGWHQPEGRAAPK